MFQPDLIAFPCHLRDAKRDAFALPCCLGGGGGGLLTIAARSARRVDGGGGDGSDAEERDAKDELPVCASVLSPLAS